MYSYPWHHWITFFYIYCFFGWIFESAYVTLKTGHFVNRGFLRLPLLPLYGTGAIIMLWVSLPFKNSLITVFITGTLAATVLEYVTGYAMERLFKMKYWDYSNQRFNLHGYICLSSSIAWGFLTILLTEIIHQPVAVLVVNLSPAVEFSMLGIISVLFFSDVFQSTKEALNLGRALETLTKLKAELEEVQVQLSLLKSETSLRMAELKEETVQKMADMKSETVQRVADMKSDTAQRMADIKSNTVQRVADMKSGTAQRMTDIKSGTAQRMTDIKSGTAQRMTDIKSGTSQRMTDIKSGTAQRMTDIKSGTAQRMTDIKSGTAQRMTDIKSGTAQRMADIKSETTQRVAGVAQKFMERTDLETTLSERLKALTEHRQTLARHMTFYRKSILKGNPSSSSRHFSEALRELKEAVDNRKKPKKSA